MPKILALSLDYDDCLVRKFDDFTGSTRQKDFDPVTPSEFDTHVNQHQALRGKDKWKQRLLEDNKPLFDFIQSKKDQYDEIIIIPGSNRLNPNVDAVHSCRNNVFSGSCYEGLEIFTEELRKRLSSEEKDPSKKSIALSLDRSLVADFFHKREPGEIFTRACAWSKGEAKEKKDFFRECPVDRTKVSLHYRYMHKLACERPDAEIDYYAIDDNHQGVVKMPNPAIIDALNDVYPKNPDIIPSNVNFCTLPYKHGVLDEKTIIQTRGIGATDSNYDQTMYRMMIASAENVQELHINNMCSCWDLFHNSDKGKQVILSSQTSSTKLALQVKFIYASHPYSVRLVASALVGVVVSAAIYAGFYYSGAKESISFAATAAEFIGMGAAIGFFVGLMLVAAKCKEQSCNDDKQVPSATAKILSQ